MHRFLAQSVVSERSEFFLSPQESHHAISVLRLRAGDAVEILDGQGQVFSANIQSIESKKVRVKINARLERKQPRREIFLAAAVVKPDRMEWMIEKAAELGAAGILPVITERTVVRLSEDRWAAKIERWRKIAEAACKQCGLAFVPPVQTPILFKQLPALFAGYDLALVPHLGERKKTLKQLLKPEHKRVLFLIGPEGDFTPSEIALAVQKGAEEVSLGENVLRSETAALYTLIAAQIL